jgi:uncharacterized glyoxalase superfamily protein PhnB
MAPDHPSQPPGRDVFNGRGLLLTLQVEDARAEFERLKGAGLEITYPLNDEHRADRAGAGVLGAVRALDPLGYRRADV